MGGIENELNLAFMLLSGIDPEYIDFGAQMVYNIKWGGGAYPDIAL